MRKRRSPLPRPAALALLGLLATALAGCGSTASVSSGRTLQVALGEYRITPQDVHTQAGSLTIIAHNYGRLTHDLAITLNGVTAASTKPIPPGQSADLQVDLAAGHYLLASNVLSDQALGEYGTLDLGS